jgi:hypothetical protein
VDRRTERAKRCKATPRRQCRVEDKGDTKISTTSHSHDSAERRKDIRYRMGASAISCWRGPDCKSFQGEGVVRDMSVAATYVLTSTCPPANATVQMEVLLSPLEGSRRISLTADMAVLRVDPDIVDDKRSGFSALGNGFSLHAISKLVATPMTVSAKSFENHKPSRKKDDE